MKKGRLKEIVAELQGASKMHLKQSKEIAAHIDDMESPTKMVSPLNFPGANSSNSSCWDGYRKDGVKDSPSGTGETVNNCVKIGSPAKENITGENTGEIKTDKKGEYTLINENSVSANKGDTIRPANNKFFKPAVIGKSQGSKDGYLIGGDYSVSKKGNKNYNITNK